MIESLTLPTTIASIACIVPLVAAVYQAYVAAPIRVNGKANILSAFKRIREEAIVTMLEPGTHDVAPADAMYNYTIVVMGDTKEEATGILQVSNPDNRGFQVLHSSETGKATTTDSDGRAIQLYHNNAIIIAEEVLGDEKALNVYGILIHRPPGVPAFPENK